MHSSHFFLPLRLCVPYLYKLELPRDIFPNKEMCSLTLKAKEECHEMYGSGGGK